MYNKNFDEIILIEGCGGMCFLLVYIIGDLMMECLIGNFLLFFN